MNTMPSLPLRDRDAQPATKPASPALAARAAIGNDVGLHVPYQTSLMTRARNMPPPIEEEWPAICLVRPQMGENIGAAARAMLNFGLISLRLVAPRDRWPNPKAEVVAVGADKVLKNARVEWKLEDALADATLVIAATARPRELEKPVWGPRSSNGSAHEITCPVRGSAQAASTRSRVMKLSVPRWSSRPQRPQFE